MEERERRFPERSSGQSLLLVRVESCRVSFVFCSFCPMPCYLVPRYTIQDGSDSFKMAGGGLIIPPYDTPPSPSRRVNSRDERRQYRGCRCCCCCRCWNRGCGSSGGQTLVLCWLPRLGVVQIFQHELFLFLFSKTYTQF